MWKASIFKIVRLAATWKNFRCGHEKMLKTDVFHKTLISRNVLKEAHIQARSMWKLTSRAFRKCGTYWAYQVLNGSYCWSKSDNCEIMAPLAKIRGITKKRHGKNNESLSSGEPKPIISNVARGPKARGQQFSMSSLSPVLRYVVTALFRSNSPLRARQH